ncbi:MAG: DNA translocase FtsK [Lachnospiraceae bacterium]|nr:DNA translocase FtsK [Lachnospiraceae bacterium]
MASNAAKKKTAATGSQKAAASKKKTTSKSSRSTSTKTAASVSRRKSSGSGIGQEQENSGLLLAREAVLWLILALCVFLFISFLGIGGYIGSVFSDICFGIFGVAAWVFPVLLFLACAFWISNRGNRLAAIKFGSCVLLYLCICCFAALIEGEYGGVYHIGKLYARCAAGKQGGGVIGGTVCYCLAPALGKVGTGVLLGVLALIALVLITQKSLFGGMRTQGGILWHSARESSKRHREERQEAAAERAERKEERQLAAAERKEERRLAAAERREERQEAAAEREEARRESAAGRRNRQAESSGESDSGQSGRKIWAHTEAERVPVSDPGWESRREDVPFLPERESTTCPIGAEYTSISRKADKNRSGAEDGAASLQNRQLDVSVMFYPQTETKRKRRHASGVTMNTRITGEPKDVREILPDSFDPEEGTKFINLEEIIAGGSADRRDGTYEATDAAGRDRRGAYEATDAVGNGLRGAEDSYLDMESLHIEGVSEPSEEEEPGEADGYKDPMQGTRSGKETDEDELPDVYSLEKEEPDGEPPAYEGSAGRTSQPGEGTKKLSGRNLQIETGTKKAGSERFSKERQEAQMEPDAQKELSGEAAAGSRVKRNPRSSEQEIAEGIASVEAEAAETAKAVLPEYVFPPLELLQKGSSKSKKGQEQEIRQTAAKLQQTLNSFGVHATVTNVSCGPSVTRYELLPEQGVKVSKIVSLSDDIKLNLAAADIRIEAPIPGKSAVGIEVPNAENGTVPLRELLESEEFQNHKSKLAFATGKDIGGKVVVSDIAKMPHLLIAGATGSGKSVCINTLIMSILYKAKPDEVKLIMIDPKVVELSVYNGIPHLLIPVVTDPKKAAGALNWGVAEMTDRYAKFAEVGVRDLKGYNQKIEALENVDSPDKPQKLPQIVIIVDELADLMMVAPGEVEDSICRLAQLARAAGIHLIIATQRPSVNVITGLIKANMPSRIAFSVSSGVDSRTIIDMYGAEKLLGKGDMLFYPQGYQKPARVQGAFVSDEEVSDVVDFLKESNSAFKGDSDMEEKIAKAQTSSAAAKGGADRDELFTEAGRFIIEKDKASIGMLQRVFKIGFNRAARIMDQLSEAGVVGPEEGTKPRKILMSEEQFENWLEEN